MRKQSTTLAKNFTVLLSSQVITWLLSLLLVIFLPRYLGAATVGKLHLATALWSIMAVVMAFGTNTLMVTEVARDRTTAPSLFGTKLVFNSLLFVLCMAVLSWGMNALNYPQTTIYVVVLIGIEFWLWQFVGTTEAFFQGIEKMEHISIGRILGHVFNVAVGVTLLLFGWKVYAIAIVRIVAALLVFAIQFFALKRTADLQPRFDYKSIPKLFRLGWPYFLAGISMTAYMQLDVVVISLLVNEETIGWYGTADQLFGTLLFIPTAFITSVYPVYSKLSINEMGSLKTLMSKNFDLMLLVGVPIGFGLFLIGNQLAVLLYGEDFVKSGPVLSAFGLVLVLTYLNMLVGQCLISIDRQKPWALVMTVATLVTIPLDLVLIPWTHATFANGALGGAIAFIITELGMLAWGIKLLPNGTLGWTNVKAGTRIIASGLLMGAVVWWFRDLFIAIPILVGMLVYVGMILLLKVITPEDMALLKGFGQRIAARFSKQEATATSH